MAVIGICVAKMNIISTMCVQLVEIFCCMMTVPMKYAFFKGLNKCSMQQKIINDDQSEVQKAIYQNIG